MTLRKKRAIQINLGCKRTLKRRLLIAGSRKQKGGRSFKKWFNKNILRREGVELEKVPSEINPKNTDIQSPSPQPLPPRQSSPEQSSPEQLSHEPPPRQSQSKQSYLLLGPTNSSNSTKSSNYTITKLSELKTSNLNYDPQIKKFMLLFEGKIKEHDDTEYTDASGNNNKRYTVSTEMLGPYLRKNKLTYDPTTQIWQELFIKHRYLLYLDQFCRFIDFIKSKKTNSGELINLGSFIEHHYFELPIAAKNMNDSLPSANNQQLTTQTYTRQVYDKFAETMTSLQTRHTMSMINDFMFLYAHGGLGHISDVNMLTVPDNVVIAFITPFNKIEATVRKEIHQKLKLLSNIIKSFIDTKKQNDFYKNPACFLRDVPFMSNTVYYYPGQLVANCLFSYDPKKSDDNYSENLYMGLYNNTQTNMRDEFFVKESDKPEFRTSLLDIFTTPEKLKLISGKVLFISCCRGSDSYIDDITTEFLYRYESIITFYNMSVCNSPLPTISADMSKAISNANIFIKFVDTEKGVFKPSARNSHDYKLFYDSALSYKFALGYTRNAKKQRHSENTVGAMFLKGLNKLGDAEKLDYIHNKLNIGTQDKTSIPDLFNMLTDVFKINLPSGKTWDDLLTKEFNFNYIKRYLNRIIDSGENPNELIAQFKTLLAQQNINSNEMNKLVDDETLEIIKNKLATGTQGKTSIRDLLNMLTDVFKINLPSGKTWDDLLTKEFNFNYIKRYLNRIIDSGEKRDEFLADFINILLAKALKSDTILLQLIDASYIITQSEQKVNISKQVLQTLFYYNIRKKLLSGDIYGVYKRLVAGKNINDKDGIQDIIRATNNLACLFSVNSSFSFPPPNDNTNSFQLLFIENIIGILKKRYSIDCFDFLTVKTIAGKNVFDLQTVLNTQFVNNIINNQPHISENIKKLLRVPRFQKLFYVSLILDNDLSNTIKKILIEHGKFYTPEILFVLVYMHFTKYENGKGANSNLNILEPYIAKFIVKGSELPDNFTADTFYRLLKDWCNYIILLSKKAENTNKFLDVKNYSNTDSSSLGKTYHVLCQKIIDLAPQLNQTTTTNLPSDWENIKKLITPTK